MKDTTLFSKQKFERFLGNLLYSRPDPAHVKNLSDSLAIFFIRVLTLRMLKI